MSMLDIGARCASCALVDFLPTTCPHCGLIYCKDHLSSHGCSVHPTSFPAAGPSTFEPKAICDKAGCDRPSIQAIAGYTPSTRDVASQVQCPACSGSFCVEHRRQDDHGCPGPRDYAILADAAAARKEKAKEVLAKHFPGHPAKSIEKPIAHTRDVPRQRPRSPDRLPPSVQMPSEASTGGSANAKPGTPPQDSVLKTKQAKMFDIHVRKIRMSAKPLDPRSKPDQPRRFFELRAGVTSRSDVEAWVATGKMAGVVDKVWVQEVTPVGKILDMVIDRAKVARPKTDDRTTSFNLLVLSAPPDKARGQTLLDLPSPASSIPEGSLVVLVQGWSA